MRNDEQEKIIEGERLLGIKAESKPAAVAPTATVTEATPVATAPAVGGIDNLTIKCVDIIDDLNQALNKSSKSNLKAVG